MSNIRILIVEDEAEEVATWEKQITRNNAKKSRSDVADFATNYGEAKELIGMRKYDAAIVDIRLKNENGVQDANSSGNEVRDLLLGTEIVLIAHLTGEAGAVNLETDYVDLVRVFEKAVGEEHDKPVHEEILDWMEDKSELIETMKSVKNNINSKMADLFYKSIWPRWGTWSASHTEGEDFVPISVTRHITSHLYSNFLEDSEGKVHPEEWYFQPPSSTRFRTGDIIIHDRSYYVLVTPRCDLERLEKGDMLLMAKLEVATEWHKDKEALDQKLAEFDEAIARSIDTNLVRSKTKKKEEALSKFRRSYYGHKNEKTMFHFLPEINQSANNSHGPFFVNFSNIVSIEAESSQAKEFSEGKIAGLSPEFVPALVQRLGTYFSRIGSPDYSHFP